MNRNLWYCGNIAVAAFLCLNISFLSATGAPINVNGLNLEKEKAKAFFRFVDKSFNESLIVNQRTVRCSGTVQGSHYPSPMYTCHGISVDGEKLYHGFSRGGKSKHECTSGCPCGTNEGHPTDIQALCNAMLQVQGVKETLIAAYVVKPGCSAKEKRAKRVKFYVDDEAGFVWENVEAPNGYINNLQCLTKEPET